MDESIFYKIVEEFKDLTSRALFFEAEIKIAQIDLEALALKDRYLAFELKIESAKNLKNQASESEYLKKYIHLLSSQKEEYRITQIFFEWLQKAQWNEIDAETLLMGQNALEKNGEVKRAKILLEEIIELLFLKKKFNRILLIVKEKKIELGKERLLEIGLHLGDRQIIEDNWESSLLNLDELSKMPLEFEEAPKELLMYKYLHGKQPLLKKREELFTLLLNFSNESEIFDLIASKSDELSEQIRNALIEYIKVTRPRKDILEKLGQRTVNQEVEKKESEIPASKENLTLEVIRNLTDRKPDEITNHKIARIIIQNLPSLSERELIDLCVGLEMSGFCGPLVHVMSVYRGLLKQEKKDLPLELLFIEISSLQKSGSHYEALTSISEALRHPEIKEVDIELYSYLEAESFAAIGKKELALERYYEIYKRDSGYRLVRERIAELEKN